MFFAREGHKSPCTLKDYIRQLKAQLEDLGKKHYYGAHVTSRAEQFLCAETPTKGALSTEKRYARKNAPAKIEYDCVKCNDQASIERTFSDYYETLFTRQTIDAVQFKNEFVPRLGEYTTACLERDITVDEIRRAIDELSPGKTLVPDTLS